MFEDLCIKTWICLICVQLSEIFWTILKVGIRKYLLNNSSFVLEQLKARVLESRRIFKSKSLYFSIYALVIDLDLEAFLIMKPEHIKEAIPNFGPRIKFEKLYNEFLCGLGEVVIVDNANKINTTPLPKIDTSNSDTDNNLDEDLDQITDEMLISLNTDIPKINEVMFSSGSKENTYLKSAKVLLLLNNFKTFIRNLF